MIARNLYNLRQTTEVAGATADLSSYDQAFVFGGNGLQAVPAGATGQPLGFFTHSCGVGEPCRVVWRSPSASFQLRLKSTGSAGDRIRCDANGYLVSSSTSHGAILGSNDFAIAQSSWSDGDATEVVVMSV